MSEPVAIVHDWLTSMRGGERVAEVLCGVFPQADLFTLTRDPARLSPVLAQRRTTTSAIHCVARAPFVSGRFRALLPLFPMAVESFKLDRYALVISSSHCVAIGAIAPPAALHVAYVHSTLRYAREAQRTYEATVPGGPLGRALFRGTVQYLRRWETMAAARPHVLIANSTYTRERIRDYYQRDALVIAPPIETRRFERAAAGVAQADRGAPFLMVSALVPNKRIELALRAFHGRPERLLVVGEGPERARLERLATPNVTFLSRVDEAKLAILYANCRALLHTGIDDFGMVMVEALAAGRPVLACAEGGALDIVDDGETGLLIDAPTVESVRAALDRFARMPGAFEPDALQASARRFDRAHFERRFAEAIDDARRQRRNAKTNGTHPGGRTHHIPVHREPAPVREPLLETKPNGQPPATTPLIAQSHVANHSRVGVAAKRFADVALAASGLVLAAPLLASLAALIPLDSRGPPLFYQRRPGLDDRPFTLVKLRTMDARGRVTRLGRMLRPLGLDELPQLWNVLKGDMSLIGPRPEVLERAQRYVHELPGYGTRHQMRPGITGWAQVNGLRGNVSIAKRLEFDIHYLREWNLSLDGRILLRTVSTVLGDTLRDLRG
jgi:lipopolysaccharide/colanic/teichoic acid biosynthesis glycosyltransferase/glycosyltransferase involved in cell wall biosynthesis